MTTLFLDERGALHQIQNLMREAKEAKIAVAFWGRGAVETLLIGRSDLDVEVVCNLDSGACNPFEIEKLQKLRPRNPVRSDPRLHGKLYWTPHGIVLGSSNASTNGLAVEESSVGWAEANVFSSDPKLIKATLEWFNNRKSAAYEIKDVDLHRAKDIWEKRAQSAAPGIRLTVDLGAAVRKAPEHPAWIKVKLIIYSEDLSEEGEKQKAADQAANPALRKFDAYEDLQGGAVAGDWLLDFWLKKKTRFGGYYYVPDLKLDDDLLTYVEQQSCVTLPGFGTLKLSADDQLDLETAASAIAQTEDTSEGPGVVVPIKEAIAFIDANRRKQNTPDIRAFERAMRDIFTEAEKAGYRPFEFLRMVDRGGALPTARRLIMSSAPSSGFTRLWELNRLDLTVEALALREPWRRLFTEEELGKARQRLAQLRYKFEA
jgi:hypothetical protein